MSLGLAIVPRGYRPVRAFAVALIVFALVTGARAEDKAIHIRLPKRSKPTPVQKLNREGVKAVEAHQYDKARKLFFSAYLLDPNDPFTLNNLGYISEIQGDLGRAQRYYDLAQEFKSNAAVSLATAKNVEGKPVSLVAGDAAEKGMQINRMNVAAISLLQKDRAPEADLLLQKALQLDPHNPFTLNNMGYTREKEGELESALRFYTEAANLNSREPIIVTARKDWRGKPISEIAALNADKLQRQLQKEQTPAARAARLNLQGVSAMNRNDYRTARKCFEEAYKLDPKNAFALNNMGFLSELNGDRETADFYYEKAREAQGHKDKVTVATRRDVEGQRVGEVAQSSTRAVEAQMREQVELKRREGGPIELRRRDGAPVKDSDVSLTPSPDRPAADQNQSSEPANGPENSSQPGAIASPPSGPTQN